MPNLSLETGVKSGRIHIDVQRGKTIGPVSLIGNFQKGFDALSCSGMSRDELMFVSVTSSPNSLQVGYFDEQKESGGRSADDSMAIRLTSMTAQGVG
jgi:hypothetical protein